MKSTLNEKQEEFCQQFLVDLNAKQAAIRAGYSEKTAEQIGYALLRKKPHVQARITELMKARAERTEIEADSTLLAINKLAHSDLRKLFSDENNTLLPMSAWPDDAAVCVASVEVDEIFEYEGREKVWQGYTKKIKFWDKPKALDMEMRHKNLYAATKVELGEKTLETLLGGSWDNDKEK